MSELVCSTEYRLNGRRFHCNEPMTHFDTAAIPDGVKLFCRKCQETPSAERIADLKRAQEARKRENNLLRCNPGRHMKRAEVDREIWMPELGRAKR